ncbi:hypothetical protein [Arthrobacter sp. NPDC057259]|uniref:hypothetical protein n=1 Tax=Arthrobacter sp. NPDC057259 TaxID=3346073 RepID=UPI00362A2EB5
MDDLAPTDGGARGRAGHGIGRDSARVYRVLAVVFTVVAGGTLAVVVVDFVIARPVAGDLFISALNSLAAIVLWRLASPRTRA